MADLFSANDLSQFQNAFKDIRDTFLKNDIVYHLEGQVYDRFMESANQRQTTNINLKGLIVDEKTEASAVKFAQMGRTDMSEHYVLLYFADLEENGLVDVNRELIMQPDRDFMTLRGQKYEVKSVIQIADLSTEKTYVRVVYRDNLRPKR